MKTIVITGASSGIGKETAKYFASKGWNVVATMRNIQKAQELKDLDHVYIYSLDVTDQKSINNAYEQIKQQFGKIDVLLNNAGYCLFGPLELSSDEQIKQTYDTLFYGVTMVTKTFIPLLRANQEGTIITVSSVGGVLTLPLTPTYHAAKYGVEGLMEALTYELAPFNIRCKLIEPGGIQTDFWNRSYQMTSGIEESVYAKEVLPYLQIMTQNSNSDRCLPIEVSKVIYEAATDQSLKLRYTVASQEFIDWRKSMSDEQWLEMQIKMYKGENRNG